jgi:hypothetical protein
VRPLLIFIDGGMGAFSVSASIGIIDEAAVNAVFNHIHNGMMHHPIPKRRSGYLPWLSLVGVGWNKAFRA